MTTTVPRLLQVRRTALVTPRTVRVTLGGDELAGFPGDGPDRRIKMFFPAPGQDRPALPRATSGGPVWPPGEARPAMRTYTVRRFTAGDGAVDRAELDVDFVLHAGDGPAAAWAEAAQPGSWVGVSEPGGRYEPDPDAAYLVVIGDETALPAVATVLDAVPAGVAARVWLEVADAAEEQRLPGSAEITWVHRGAAPAGAPLVDAVQGAKFPAGPGGQAWLAGESACVRTLRRHLLDDRGIDRRRVYATGYWRAR